jgi:hypothetical protein
VSHPESIRVDMAGPFVMTMMSYPVGRPASSAGRIFSRKLALPRTGLV